MVSIGSGQLAAHISRNAFGQKVAGLQFLWRCGHFAAYLSCEILGQKVSDQWFPLEVWGPLCCLPLAQKLYQKVCGQWFLWAIYHAKHPVRRFLTSGFHGKCGFVIAYPSRRTLGHGRFLTSGFRGSVATLLPTSLAKHSVRRFLTGGFHGSVAILSRTPYAMSEGFWRVVSVEV